MKNMLGNELENEKYLEFMREFEAVKIVILEEIMKAKDPNSLVILGRRLQEEGDRMKVKEEILKNIDFEESKKSMLSEMDTSSLKNVIKEKKIIKEEKNIKDISESKERNTKIEDDKKIVIKSEKKEEIKERIDIRESDLDKKNNQSSPKKFLGLKGISFGKIEPLEKKSDLTKPAESLEQTFAGNNSSEDRMDVAIEPLKKEDISSENKLTHKEDKNLIFQKVESSKKEVEVVEEVAKNKLLEKISPDKLKEIVNEMIKSGDGAEMLIFLDKFDNKGEVISQPEVLEAFKRSLEEGMHFYDVYKLVNIPGIPKSLFEDQSTQAGILTSLKSFVMNQNEESWSNISRAVDLIVEKAEISDNGLKGIAEDMKGNPESYRLFVEHFGSKRIYPELSQ